MTILGKEACPEGEKASRDKVVVYDLLVPFLRYEREKERGPYFFNWLFANVVVFGYMSIYGG